MADGLQVQGEPENTTVTVGEPEPAVEQQTESEAVETEGTGDKWADRLAALKIEIAKESGQTDADDSSAEAEAEDKSDDDDGGEEEQSSASPQIPKARLDEQLRATEEAKNRLSEAERENQFLKGQLAALKSQQGQTTQQEQPAQKEEGPDPAVRLAEIRSRVNELPIDVADATISAAEAKAEMAKLQAEMDDLQSQIEAKKAADAAPSAAEEMVERHLANVTQAIFQEHPYLEPIANNEGLVNRLKELAYAVADAQGDPINPGVEGTIKLRRYMGKLSDQWGPRWQVTPNEVQSQADDQQAEETESQKREKASRKAKADMANALPPNTDEIGDSARPEGGITESQWNQMSFAEKQAAVKRGAKTAFM